MSRIRYNDFFNEIVACLYWENVRSQDMISFEGLAKKFAVKYETGYLAEAQRDLKSKGLLRGPDPIDGDGTAFGRLTGEGLRYAEDKGLDDLQEDEPEDDTTHKEPPPSEASIDSSLWTGLPKQFSLTSDRLSELVRELENAEAALHSSSTSQETRAQARAYILAARSLAEAPDPPYEAIWDLIGRANALAGIASLLVSVISLFVSVAH